MPTAQEIMQFHFSATVLKQSARKIIPVALSSLNEHSIDRLQKIREELGASAFTFSNNNLIPQVFRKFKNSFSKLHADFERRELRTLTYSLSYSEQKMQSIFSI